MPGSLEILNGMKLVEFLNKISTGSAHGIDESYLGNLLTAVSKDLGKCNFIC